MGLAMMHAQLQNLQGYMKDLQDFMTWRLGYINPRTFAQNSAGENDTQETDFAIKHT